MLLESAKGEVLKSAEYVVVHSKGESEIEMVRYGLTIFYQDFPPDGLAARVTNWTRGTNVGDFR